MPRDAGRLGTWIAIGAAALYAAALLAPLFVGAIPCTGDLGNYYLPMKQFYAGCLRAGDEPWWCPLIYGGYDLHGDGQLGMLHPIHPLMFGLLPFDWAYALELALPYPIAALGMARLLRRWDLDRDAAALGGLLFACCGFLVYHYEHTNALTVLCHLPWVLWAVDLLARSPTTRRRATAGAGLSLLIASMLVMGYPHHFVLTMALAGLYGLLVIRRWRTAGAAVLAVIAGGLMGSPQVVATATAVEHSHRAERTAAYNGQYSLAPFQLTQWVAPYLFAERVALPVGAEGLIGHIEFGAYAGATTLPLATLALVWRRPRGGVRSRAERLVTPLTALAGVALVLSFGEYAGMHEVIHRIPGLNLFRCPARFLVWFQVAVAGLAAVGLHRLGREADRPDRSLGLMLGLGSFPLLAIAVAAWVGAGGEFALASWPLRLAGPVLLGSAAALVALTVRGHRWARPALIALAGLDAISFGVSFAFREPPRSRAVLAAAVDLPEDYQSGERLANARDFARPALRGVPTLDGYAGLAPLKSTTNEPGTGPRAAGAAWERFGTPPDWVRVADPMPRALLMKDIKGKSDRAPGRVEVVADRPGWIVLRCQNEGAGHGVIRSTESWHPRWRSVINGKLDWPIERIDGDFLGVRVPGGHSEVMLIFDPRFHVTAWPAFGGAVLALLVLAFGWWGLGWIEENRS